MRISDWSSDVCSSDLSAGRCCGKKGVAPRGGSVMLLPYGWQLAFTNSRSRELRHCVRPQSFLAVSTPLHCACATEIGSASCRERVSPVRVDLGGRRIIKNQTNTQNTRMYRQAY